MRQDDEFVKCVCPGTYKIQDGKITNASFLSDKHYYRIVESDFNDGVHAPDDVLTDEEFTGSIWVLRLPPEFLRVVKEMQEWETKNGAVVAGPYKSESFANTYSYTMMSDSATGGNPTVWSTFGSRLNAWRKI